MKRKADSTSGLDIDASESDSGTICNNEEKAVKKPRATTKGKAKASQNEQDWPEYFQTVSESTISFRDSRLMSLNV